MNDKIKVLEQVQTRDLSELIDNLKFDYEKVAL